MSSCMVESVSLFFKEGSSDKFYDISLEMNGDGTYSVPFVFGRVGTSGQSGYKCQRVSLVDAQKAYNKTVKEKTGKGYQVKSGNKLVTHTPAQTPAKPTTLVPAINKHAVPQLLNFISEDEALALCKDDDYCAQEKKDGKRMRLHSFLGGHGQGVKATNKKAQDCSFNAEYESDFLYLMNEAKLNTLSLDGESIGDTFYVFDITDRGGIDIRIKPYSERYNALVDIVTEFPEHIKLIPTAVTTEEKLAMFKSLKERGKEGIVFKRLVGAYTPGRPNKGGQQLKHKFYAEATCKIMSISKTKNSIGLCMIGESGKWEFVGNCTVTETLKGTLKAHDFCEIKYLYAYKGGCLYQPSFKGIRDDVDDADCNVSQLKFKSVEEADDEEDA